MSFYKDIDFDNMRIINTLSNNLFYNTPNRNIPRGKKLHDPNAYLNIVKENSFIMVEGKIKSQSYFGRYDIFFTIDRCEKTFLKTKCTCIDFKNNSAKTHYLCKHLVGAVFCFFDKLAVQNYFQEDKKDEDIFLEIFENKEIHKKEKIEIETTIYIDNQGFSTYFDISFKLGNEKKYILKSLKDFINSRKREEDYQLGKYFIYNIKNHYFSPTDDKIINFIGQQVSLTENFKALYGKTVKNLGAKGKVLRLPSDSMKEILETFLNKNIELLINGNELEVVKVIKDDLPIEFTLRDDDKFISIEFNKFISLNKTNEVFYYDKKIYIPSQEQQSYVSKINNIFEREGEIKLSSKRGSEVFENVIPRLKSISKNIILDENIKGKIEDGNLSVEFLVDKERKKIFIESKISYGNTKINNSNGKYIIRDFEREKEINDTLNNLGFIKGENTYDFLGDDEKLFDFLNDGVKEIKKYGEVFYSESFKKYRILGKPILKAEIKEQQDYLDFNFDIENVDSKDILKILDAFKENKKFFKLDNESFLDLSDRELYNFISLIDNLDTKKDFKLSNLQIPKNRAFYLNDYIDEKKLDFVKGKEFAKNISEDFKNISMAKFEVPKNLNANLREYQTEGYKWFRNLDYYGFGGILADEMGLGKTIQTISYILSKENSKSIIVTPTSLIYNWKNEFEKFAPKVKVAIIHGGKIAREKIINDIDEYDVLLTTYGTLKNDLDSYNKIDLDIMVIDEAQNIKNPVSRNAIAVKSVNAKRKFALTGTPIENNLLELWSIFDFIMPGYLYNKNKFSNKFISKDSKYKELKRAIEPFILRREKRNVINELPDKIEKKFFVELSSQQKKVYASYIEKIREQMADTTETKNKIEVFSYLMKLRQLCLDPSIVIDGYKGENSKLDIAIELIESYIESGHKILMFSQFTKVLAILKERLDKKNINYSYIDGSVKAKERLKSVDKFNENKDKKVFLISLKAGGTGLNLTSADIVIHFDPWWNPAVEDQATDRAHRIGQKNKVEVIKLISKGTIEEKILKLQEGKKDIIEKVMTGSLSNASLLSSLSEKEIMDLFN